MFIGKRFIWLKNCRQRVVSDDHRTNDKVRFSSVCKPGVYLYYWKKGCKEGDKIVIVVIYVDDILITGNCKDKINETKRQLAKEFKMKDLGEPKQFLGINI